LCVERIPVEDAYGRSLGASSNGARNHVSKSRYLVSIIGRGEKHDHADQVPFACFTKYVFIR
jgi:hypothetical protein